MLIGKLYNVKDVRVRHLKYIDILVECCSTYQWTILIKCLRIQMHGIRCFPSAASHL